MFGHILEAAWLDFIAQQVVFVNAKATMGCVGYMFSDARLFFHTLNWLEQA
jgi:hypothetical protein